MPRTSTGTLGATMLQGLSTYVKDFQAAWKAGHALSLPNASEAKLVVFCGMGGSGIGGDLVESLVRDASPVPVLTCNDYRLPKSVGKGALVIATSYSGNTEETLTAVAAARERGASIAGVASGGALGEFLTKNRLPYYAVPAGRQPRAALAFLFGAASGMAHRIGLASLALDSADETQLRNLQVRLEPKIAGSENEALRLAETLRHSVATIYAEDALGAVARRWKAQLNENAKLHARAEILPEANHNDLVAWSQAPVRKEEVLVLLRRSSEPAEIQVRFEFLRETAQRRKIPFVSPRAASKSPLGQSLELLLLGDYASVYTAILRQVDPTPVQVIEELKARLASTGRAREARKRLGLAP